MADKFEHGGKGCLIAIVGPSGAGKDTLLDIAKDRLFAEPRIHFVRRAITRPASVGEDHLPLSPAEFARDADRGEFALHWDAHGLRYGLPVILDQWLSNGDVVVANASRATLVSAQVRYPQLEVVNIVASSEVLADRLSMRGRETTEDQASRLARSALIEAGLSTVHTIDNSGLLEIGADALVNVIRRALQDHAPITPNEVSL